MSVPSERSIAKHLALIAGIAALYVLCVIYPFLPGGYDSLAVPISTMAQAAGVVGLPLVVVGLLWLAMPRLGFAFAVTAMAVGTFVALVLALVAKFSVGNAFGMIAAAVWAYVVVRLIPRLKAFRGANGGALAPAPLYLAVLPVVALATQLALAAPLTQWSRARAIASASEYIGDIETYRAHHGRYPVSLEAQHPDYKSRVVGVERYFYSSQGDGYNLVFEQPRFVLDRLGTREWVVYNPRDEHRLYSHTAWLLSTSRHVESGQGWYASGDTGQPHWHYFYFD